MIRIDWSGPLTKGRQVYASVLGINYVPKMAINYDTGFLVGWDRWSDGNFDLAPGLFR